MDSLIENFPYSFKPQPIKYKYKDINVIMLKHYLHK